MAAEQGVSVDEEGFRSLMAEQKERARADARSKKTGHTDVRVFHDIEKEMGGGSTFLGYTEQAPSATVAGDPRRWRQAPAATAPAEVEVDPGSHSLLRRDGRSAGRPRYDSTAPAAAVVEVTRRPGPDPRPERPPRHPDRGRHGGGGEGLSPRLTRRASPGDRSRPHRYPHGVRGTAQCRVRECGPGRFRELALAPAFRLPSLSALAGSQLNDIEELVNEKLAEDLPVTTEVMSIEKAKEMGAIALFGEKYGSEVRVVTIGDGFDRELCGGTHVPTTGHIGRVTVLGEGSVASGVRRIEALVGDGAYEFQAKEHALVSQLSQLVGGRADELPERIESLLAKLRESEKELDKIRTEQALRRGGELAAASERVG